MSGAKDPHTVSLDTKLPPTVLQTYTGRIFDRPIDEFDSAA